ncbi:hypothetical protein OAD26_00070 [bacterium]|nr:hypothetical protein [bacterium]
MDPNNKQGTFKGTISDKDKGVFEDAGIVFDTDADKVDTSYKQTPKNAPADSADKKSYTEPEEVVHDENVFDITGAFNNNVEAGTIVTDKKTKKSSFGGTLKKAFSELAGEAKEVVENTEILKKEEKKKVAPASTRKEVIQKASKNARVIPKDDHKVVVQKIRTFQQDAERATGKSFRIKDKVEEKKTWTQDDTKKNSAQVTESVHVSREAITPGGGHGLVAPTIDDHLEDFDRTDLKKKKKKDKAEKKNDVSIETEALVATEHPARFKKKRSTTKPKKKWSGWSFFVGSDNETKNEVIETAPTVEREPEAPEVEVEVEKEPEAPEPLKPSTPVDDIAAEQSTFHSDELENQKQISIPSIESVKLKQSEPKKSKGLYPIVLIVVIVVAIVAGVSLGFMLTKNRDDITVVQPAVSIVSYLKTDTKVAVPLTASRDVLLENIKMETTNAASGVTQIYPTVTKTSVGGSTTKTVPATTPEIFTVLSPRTLAPFIRSIDRPLMFGAITVSQNEPFIVMKTDNFDVAFAGMLDWEPFISSDLAPIFGEPVSRTYDINARTVDQTFDAHFIDTFVNNRGVRVLRDETGTDRIIYTFVDKHTILITSNTEALTKIISTF